MFIITINYVKVHEFCQKSRKLNNCNYALSQKIKPLPNTCLQTQVDMPNLNPNSHR